MSESLIILDENLKPTLAGEFDNLKTAALESSALIGIVRNQEQDQAAESAASQVSALIKAVEKRRVAVKAPFLEACRQIDACAAKAVSDLKEEEIRLNRAIGDYKQALIEEARRKEVERQEELRRIAEQAAAEQRRIQAEALAAEKARQAEAEKAEKERQAVMRAAEEARQAELRRIAEQEATAKNEAQRKKFEEQRAAMEAQRKAQELKYEAERLEQAARYAAAKKETDAAQAAELKRQHELAAQAAEAVGPQRGIAKTGNQIVREVYKFDVVNVWDLVKARPDLVTVEPKTRDINEAIALGMTECKGLRIYKDVSVSRRSTAATVGAIDV